MRTNVAALTGCSPTWRCPRSLTASGSGRSSWPRASLRVGRSARGADWCETQLGSLKDGSVDSYMNPKRRALTGRVNAPRYTTDTGRDKARQASRTVKARRIANGEVAQYERERYASHPQHQLAHKVRSRLPGSPRARASGSMTCRSSLESAAAARGRRAHPAARSPSWGCPQSHPPTGAPPLDSCPKKSL